MVVMCSDCGRKYDDVYRLTYCPHETFQMQTIVVGPEGVRGIATSVKELKRLLGESAGCAGL